MDKRDEKLEDVYDIKEELGRGQFAVVKRCISKATNEAVAAKFIKVKRSKSSRNGLSRELIERESSILKSLEHDKVLKLHDVFDLGAEMCLVLELLSGGELFDKISEQEYLTEAEAGNYMKQVLQAMAYLHTKSIVHLDIKPENIVLKEKEGTDIKVIDFGLAQIVKPGDDLREMMGTPEFVAPEVINYDQIGLYTDMWALGVLAYILLSGCSPFLGDDNQETYANICQVDYHFDEEYFDQISEDAKIFVQELLIKNPKKRNTAEDCLDHPWIRSMSQPRARQDSSVIHTARFKAFQARRRWQQSFQKMKAITRFSNLLKLKASSSFDEPPKIAAADVEKNEIPNDENASKTVLKDSEEVNKDSVNTDNSNEKFEEPETSTTGETKAENENDSDKATAESTSAVDDHNTANNNCESLHIESESSSSTNEIQRQPSPSLLQVPGITVSFDGASSSSTTSSPRASPNMRRKYSREMPVHYTELLRQMTEESNQVQNKSEVKQRDEDEDESENREKESAEEKKTDSPNKSTDESAADNDSASSAEIQDKETLALSLNNSVNELHLPNDNKGVDSSENLNEIESTQTVSPEIQMSEKRRSFAENESGNIVKKPPPQVAKKPPKVAKKPIEVPKKATESAKKPVEILQKATESAKKTVEVPKKATESAKKPVEIPKKATESAKKPVEIPKKATESAKKPVEVPKQAKETPMESKQQAKTTRNNEPVEILEKTTGTTKITIAVGKKQAETTRKKPIEVPPNKLTETVKKPIIEPTKKSTAVPKKTNEIPKKTTTANTKRKLSAGNIKNAIKNFESAKAVAVPPQVNSKPPVFLRKVSSGGSSVSRKKTMEANEEKDSRQIIVNKNVVVVNKTVNMKSKDEIQNKKIEDDTNDTATAADDNVDGKSKVDDAATILDLSSIKSFDIRDNKVCRISDRRSFIYDDREKKTRSVSLKDKSAHHRLSGPPRSQSVSDVVYFDFKDGGDSSRADDLLLDSVSEHNDDASEDVHENEGSVFENEAAVVGENKNEEATAKPGPGEVNEGNESEVKPTEMPSDDVAVEKADVNKVTTSTEEKGDEIITAASIEIATEQETDKTQEIHNENVNVMTDLVANSATDENYSTAKQPETECIDNKTESEIREILKNEVEPVENEADLKQDENIANNGEPEKEESDKNKTEAASVDSIENKAELVKLDIRENIAEPVEGEISGTEIDVTVNATTKTNAKKLEDEHVEKKIHFNGKTNVVDENENLPPVESKVDKTVSLESKEDDESKTMQELEKKKLIQEKKKKKRGCGKCAIL